MFLRICLTVCISSYCFFVNAQNNLIKNPGFEDMILCPTDSVRWRVVNENPTISQYTSNWESVFIYWWIAGGIPYYHECANEDAHDFFGTKSILLGNPIKYSGKAFVCISVTISHGRLNYSASSSHRSFLGTNLKKKLIPLHKYKLSYKIYAADSNYMALSGFGACFFNQKTFIDPIGGKKDSLNRSLWDFSSYVPKVFSDSVITTNEWNLVSGEFIADSSYSYLAIGNFENYASMQQIIIKPPPYDFRGNYANFFIDDVELYDITKQIGNKKSSLCIGDSLKLWPENLTNNHYWSISNNGIDTFSLVDTILLFPQNKMVVYLFEKGTGLIDSCEIKVIETNISLLPNDTFFCKEKSIFLESAIAGNSYLWSNGSTLKSIEVSESGVFLLIVDLDGCAIFDSITVNTCLSNVFFPNSFTPNGDGLNDVFKPVYQQIKDYNLDIFDRWGSNIFTSNNIDVGWDGISLSGNINEAGVYFYISSYLIENELKITKGTVTLLR